HPGWCKTHDPFSIYLRLWQWGAVNPLITHKLEWWFEHNQRL
ncbi:MAG: hypothetical protein JWN15_567, partial [Firmicutes bacterium]|nr:hypothetical protein [Bacillota bacterium]